MTTRRPTDPAALAARLGARAFGDARRWWTTAEIAAHHGYARNSVKHWPSRGWGADLTRRKVATIGGGWHYEYWCAVPPPPPPDTRARRDPGGKRAQVVAAVLAAGGPPGAGNRRQAFWRDIGAAVGLSRSAAQSRWQYALTLGEVSK